MEKFLQEEQEYLQEKQGTCLLPKLTSRTKMESSSSKNAIRDLQKLLRSNPSTRRYATGRRSRDPRKDARFEKRAVGGPASAVGRPARLGVEGWVFWRRKVAARGVFWC